MPKSKKRVQNCTNAKVALGRARKSKARQTVERAILTRPGANVAVLEPVLRHLRVEKLKKATQAAFDAWVYASYLLYLVQRAQR